MTDTATVKKMTPKKSKPRVTEADVLAYLQRRPQFFEKHADLFDNTKIAPREGNVTSLQGFRANKLEKRSENLATRHEMMMRTAAYNSKGAAAVFSCIEAMMQVSDFAALRKFLQTDLLTAFDLDATRLFRVGEENTATQMTVNDISKHFEAGNRVTLRTLYDAEDRVFYGTKGKLMKSDVLILLQDTFGTVLGMLAMASKDETRFYEGQAHDLIDFFARMLSVRLAQVQ